MLYAPNYGHRFKPVSGFLRNLHFSETDRVGGKSRFKPEFLPFYVIKGVGALSQVDMDLNRELRRVGHAYTIDRKKFLQESQ
jgi:hypothetical protein